MHLLQVCLRIKPPERDETSFWRWKDTTITQEPTKEYKEAVNYTFDHLFTPENSNATIFSEVVRPLVHNVMRGYHASVMAYGQVYYDYYYD